MPLQQQRTAVLVTHNIACNIQPKQQSSRPADTKIAVSSASNTYEILHNLNGQHTFKFHKVTNLMHYLASPAVTLTQHLPV